MNALQLIQTKKYTNSQKEKANYFLNAFKFKGEVLDKLTIPVVVESFYCNQDDGEYNNNPCSEQCKFCKSAESLQ